MSDYFHEFQESQVKNLTWQSVAIGPKIKEKHDLLKSEINPVTASITPSSCSKNLLRAYVIFETKDNWYVREWTTPYLSGFKFCAGYRTAGNAVMDYTKNPTSQANKKYFEAQYSKFFKKWDKTNGPSSASYHGFTQSNAHTEQTFLFDVSYNNMYPPKMEPNTKPMRVILHLFSTRRACEKCSLAISGLYKSRRRYERFMKSTFRNNNLAMEDIEFKVLFTHLNKGHNVIVGAQDFDSINEKIWNISTFNAYGTVIPQQMTLRNPTREEQPNSEQICPTIPQKKPIRNMGALTDLAARIHKPTK